MSAPVFCIGLPQTGGNIVRDDLLAKGYKVRAGAAWSTAAANLYLERGDKSILVDCLREGHNAWFDWPAVCYRPLFERYPEAKFVLTVCGSSPEWLEQWKAFQEELLEPTDPKTAFELPLTLKTVAHLFGEARPSLGHAVEVYERHTRDAEAFMVQVGASFVKINPRSRRAHRTLGRFIPSLVEPEDQESVEADS